MTRLMQFVVPGAAFGAGMLAVWVGLSLAGASVPASADVTGFSGNAGEWEITATLTRTGDSRELSGPMTMKHVGWCSVSDSQEKHGLMHIRPHPVFSTIDVAVQVDGVTCTFTGSRFDAYEGKMKCPDRRPVQMLMWIRS